MKKFENCILFSPGGRFPSPNLSASLKLLENKFSRVVYSPIEASGYFAGTIEDRIDQFRQALIDSEAVSGVNWLMSIRGGYGSIDLLPFFNAYHLKKRMVLSGFSDISVLLNAHQDDDLFFPVYGMNAISSLSGDASPISMDHIMRIIDDFDNYNYSDAVFDSMKVINPGQISSEIFGGCLTVLVSMIGTTYFPNLKNKILFLEDVSEPVYKIDRMLKQLEIVGILDQLGGVILGDFFNCQSQFDVTPEDVFKKYFKGKNYPVVTGFPMGHGKSQVPLKFKWNVELYANSSKVKIIYQI